MEADARLLTELVAISALLASTIEYCEIVRRRVVVRQERVHRAEFAESGLRALVRVLEAGPTEPGHPSPSRPRSDARRAFGAWQPTLLPLLEDVQSAGRRRERSGAWG